MPTVTIVGLGLIGGSIGMAMRRANLGLEVIGHDRSHEEAGRAKKLGAVDRAEWNLPRAIERADLVIVAVPVGEMTSVFRDSAQYLRPGAIVTDTGSTKAAVMSWAEEHLPQNVSFVGGHPMAGKERSGIAEADANLFAGATWCLIPGAGSAPEATDRVSRLVEAIGARPYFLDPIEHDSYVAAVSHLPFVAAAALVNAASSSPGWRDAGRLAAGGFRDTTRVASGDVTVHRDICRTNRAGLLRWLDKYLASLGDFREAIEAGDERLDELLGRAKETRDQWQIDQSRDTPEQLPSTPMPTAGDSFGQMFFGRRFGRGGEKPGEKSNDRR